MDIDMDYLNNITNKQKLLYYYTVLDNPYIPVTPYPKQSIPLLYCLEEEHNEQVHSLLAGGSGFGGKTYLGSMLAVQFLQEDDYTCLVTRRNYAELVDTNSIWENLIDWCCNVDLDDDIRCEYYKGRHRIESPNGNTIYFKAFDRTDKKQKFKSASYDRIINDEASELPNGILQFQYRSMRNTSNIPRSIINLSNPSGESTNYLVEKFVDGDKPYLSLGWQDNIHINQKAYHEALKELDYIDYQYQALGDWHYTVSIGDLISDKEIDEARVNIKNYDYNFYLLSVDLASTGSDLTVISLLGFEDGIVYLLDSCSSKEAIADKLIVETCYKYKDICNDIVIEQEGGSTPTYFRNYINEKLKDYDLDYNVYLQRVNRSKYQRARPLCSALKNGKCFINSLFTDYDKFKYELSNLNPLGEGASPNFVDSISLGFNWIDNKRLKNNKVRVVKL